LETRRVREKLISCTEKKTSRREGKSAEYMEDGHFALAILA
jgi:hypothetical protein